MSRNRTVEGNGVGSLNARQAMALLGGEDQGATVGGIHMEPETMGPGQVVNLGQGVNAAGDGGAGGGHHRKGTLAPGPAALDAVLQGGGVHLALLVGRHRHQALAA
jgi:hypothetical protein